VDEMNHNWTISQSNMYVMSLVINAEELV
jgi:hypothetical protein